MLLRPATAAWFELLAERDALGRALRILAASGQVQLEAHSDMSAAHLLPHLRGAVDEYRRLALRYAQYWPASAAALVDAPRELEKIPRGALDRLRTWAANADPLITALQLRANERGELELLDEMLAVSGPRLPNLGLFAETGLVLARRAYVFADGTEALRIPPALLSQRIGSGAQNYLLAVGPGDSIEALDDGLSARKARRFRLPARLPADRGAARAFIAARNAVIATESSELRARIAQLSEAHAVSAARADLEFVEWLAAHVPEMAVTEHFVWITGWTTDLSGAALRRALEAEGVHFLLRFPATPEGFVRPVVLRNPRWAQPFELFARLLGMPTAAEADPSVILALIVPVMFGFMFGDVAQGAILVIAGLLLCRRFPALALLIPGGVAAMGFGLLFGSVFAREDLLPALWLRPLQQPLTLLLASLAFGSAIVLLGLLLDAVQHSWAGVSRTWWSTRAGLLLCYLGMISAVFDPRTLWACLIGLAWYWVGSALQAPAGGVKALTASVGESLEILLQLFVNTLSFIRIGAFALAHAGLAAAIGGVAASVSSRPLSWLVLLLGNALVILIEGVVVGIQTTRLVLFEFFIRFLHGSGRPFRPLVRPPVARPNP